VDGVTDQALLATLPVEKPRQRGLWLFYTLIGILIGAAGDRFFLAPARNADIASRAQEARAVVPSAFSRVGDRLVVPEASPLRTLLTVAAPTMKEVARTLVLPATVEADPSRTVKVMPPVTGRVIELKVQLGGRVVQGQELAVIDSGDLAQAYSDIEKARSTLTLTKKALDRQMGLEKAGGAAIRDREQAQSDYAQAAAELERSEARLRAIGIPADQKESRLLSIKAAVSGSVIDLQIAPGAFVNDPTAAMMTIANLDTIWVTASVPEKDIAFVFPGQTVKVTFRSYPDDVFEGKVLFVSDVVESDTRRNKVRIAFDNPDKILKPNMFADTTFVAPAVSRLMVPTSALLMTNDATSVFVEVSDWAFERRNVEIAYQEGTAVAIKAGIRPGERVVVKGGVRLND
jgi:cobalt-zinc-cadmium efflux system membrane fusion protein